MADSSKTAFEIANPPAFNNLQGDKNAFGKLQEIEAWAKRELEATGKHISANRDAWLNQERQAVALEYSKRDLTLDPPGFRFSIEDEAQKRVSVRSQQAMAAVNFAKEKRIEDVMNVANATDVTRKPNDIEKPAEVETQKTPADTVNEIKETTKRAPAHPLKRETHSIVDRAQDVRIRAGKHFRAMRNTFIDQATARGSESAVRDVYRNNIMRLKRIDKAEHRLLDKAFKRHGIDRAHTPLQGQSGPSM